MKQTLTFVFLIVLLNIYTSVDGLAQSPSWIWSEGIGASLFDKANSVTTDDFGNLIITGSFQGTVDFDPANTFFAKNSNGDLDVFLLKLNSAGGFVWVKSFGDVNTDEGTSIRCAPSGNFYVTGHFQGTVDFDPGTDSVKMTSKGNYDIFISKFDSSGALIWTRQMGGTSIDEPISLTIDVSENIYTTGYFSNTSDFNPDSVLTYDLTSSGGQDIFISKIDSSGNFIWAGNMGGAGSDRGYSIAVDASGNIYTTGHFSATADFDPSINSYDLTSIGANDIFISKLDHAGNFVWAEEFGRTNSDQGRSISVDSIGNIFATGSFSGTVDFNPHSVLQFSLSSGGSTGAYLLALDSSGQFIWAKALATSSGSAATGQSLLTDPITGDVLVSGNYTGSLTFDPSGANLTVNSNGNDDIFMARFDGAGNLLWGNSTGGSNGDYCGSISLGSNGILSIAGAYYSPAITFGNNTITNAVTTGQPDIYIAQLNPLITGVSETETFGRPILFPIPATNKLYISFPALQSYLAVEIKNSNGSLVFSKSFPRGSIFEIDTDEFNSGVYYLQGITDKRVIREKFSVIR